MDDILLKLVATGIVLAIVLGVACLIIQSATFIAIAATFMAGYIVVWILLWIWWL